MTFEIVTTTGGARAVRDCDVGEVMHPIVGPLIEAPRLYVEPAAITKGTLFDVGLGAGSNAIEAMKRAEDLTIVSFDRTLGALELALTLPADFGLQGGAGDAARALVADHYYEDERVRWCYVDGNLPDSLAVAERPDVVFWDLFSPKSNPVLWGVGAFEKLRARCHAGTVVRTYSGATSVRSALLLAGFHVGLGPHVDLARRKRSTIATLDRTLLEEPLDARWLERVQRSSAPLPYDAPPDALQRLSVVVR